MFVEHSGTYWHFYSFTISTASFTHDMYARASQIIDLFYRLDKEIYIWLLMYQISIDSKNKEEKYKLSNVKSN